MIFLNLFFEQTWLLFLFVGLVEHGERKFSVQNSIAILEKLRHKQTFHDHVCHFDKLSDVIVVLSPTKWVQVVSISANSDGSLDGGKSDHITAKAPQCWRPLESIVRHFAFVAVQRHASLESWFDRIRDVAADSCANYAFDALWHSKPKQILHCRSNANVNRLVYNCLLIQRFNGSADPLLHRLQTKALFWNGSRQPLERKHPIVFGGFRSQARLPALYDRSFEAKLRLGKNRVRDSKSKSYLFECIFELKMWHILGCHSNDFVSRPDAIFLTFETCKSCSQCVSPNDTESYESVENWFVNQKSAIRLLQCNCFSLHLLFGLLVDFKEEQNGAGTGSAKQCNLTLAGSVRPINWVGRHFSLAAELDSIWMHFIFLSFQDTNHWSRTLFARKNCTLIDAVFAHLSIIRLVGWAMFKRVSFYWICKLKMFSFAAESKPFVEFDIELDDRLVLEQHPPARTRFENSVLPV